MGLVILLGCTRSTIFQVAIKNHIARSENEFAWTENSGWAPEHEPRKREEFLVRLIARFELKKASNRCSKALCRYCFVIASSNSTYLKADLIECQHCPTEVKIFFAEGAARNFGRGKASLTNALKVVAEQAEAEGVTLDVSTRPEALRGNGRHSTSSTLSSRTSEEPRRQPDFEKVDSSFSKWAFSLGYAGFGIFEHEDFHAALAELNRDYADTYTPSGERIARGRNQLTAWLMANKMLDLADAETFEAVRDMIEHAHGRCLLNDGWSGLQLKHVLNLLMTTPIPVFLGNVYTGEERVTGEFTAKQLLPHITKWNAEGLCTDNAAVMRKAWRLLLRWVREERGKDGRFFVPFGCFSHSLNLWQKDFLKLEEHAVVIKAANMIARYFRRNLGAGGRFTLERHQLRVLGKKTALTKGQATRWGAEVCCVRQQIGSREALTLTIQDTTWKSSNVDAEEIEAIVMDDEHHLRGKMLVQFSDTSRYAIVMSQAHRFGLADAFNQILRIDLSVREAELHLQSLTADELLVRWEKRLKFLYNPAMLVW